MVENANFFTIFAKGTHTGKLDLHFGNNGDGDDGGHVNEDDDVGRPPARMGSARGQLTWIIIGLLIMMMSPTFSVVMMVMMSEDHQHRARGETYWAVDLDPHLTVDDDGDDDCDKDDDGDGDEHCLRPPAQSAKRRHTTLGKGKTYRAVDLDLHLTFPPWAPLGSWPEGTKV